MQEHQLFLNLTESNQMVARCGCGGWMQEKHVGISQQPSEVVRELEKEFEEHIGEKASTFVPLPPVL